MPVTKRSASMGAAATALVRRVQVLTENQGWFWLAISPDAGAAAASWHIRRLLHEVLRDHAATDNPHDDGQD